MCSVRYINRNSGGPTEATFSSGERGFGRCASMAHSAANAIMHPGTSILQAAPRSAPKQINRLRVKSPSRSRGCSLQRKQPGSSRSSNWIVGWLDSRGRQPCVPASQPNPAPHSGQDTRCHRWTSTRSELADPKTLPSRESDMGFMRGLMVAGPHEANPGTGGRNRWHSHPARPRRESREHYRLPISFDSTADTRDSG